MADIEVETSVNAEVDAAVAIPPPARVSEGAHISTLEEYRALYARSIACPNDFWAEMARKHLHWFRDFTEVSGGTFENGDIRWFSDGQTNVSYNCVDRHVNAGRGDDVAIIFEGDEPGDGRTYTYKQVRRHSRVHAGGGSRIPGWLVGAGRQGRGASHSWRLCCRGAAAAPRTCPQYSLSHGKY